MTIINNRGEKEGKGYNLSNSPSTVKEATKEQHPVAAAVEPLRNDAIQRAEEAAKKKIEKMKDKFQSDFQNNLKNIVPFKMSCYHPEYKQRSDFKKMIESLTTRIADQHYSENVREFDKTKTDKFIELSKANADAKYTAYINKLIFKVGDCKSATLEGSHVWGSSFLTIEKEDGVQEIWKTQMIINCSKLGNLFNQFPTRKVKRKG